LLNISNKRRKKNINFREKNYYLENFSF